MPTTSHIRRAVCRLRVTTEAAAVAFTLLLVMAVGVPPAGAQKLPTDPKASCTVSASVFNGWFQSGSPSLNGVVNPANSVTFPNAPNCSFYQWAQQMFLWLTSPAPKTYGGGGGRIFASPAFFTVSPADSTGKRTLIPNDVSGILHMNLRAAQAGVHGLPVIMSKSGEMFEVQPAKLSPAGKPLVLNQAGKEVEASKATLQNGKLVLLDNAGKPIQGAKPILRKLAPQTEETKQPGPEPVTEDLIAQKLTIAGTTVFLNTTGGVIDVEQGQADDSVLEAQNGSLIYYVTMVNDVYAYFLTGTKDGGISPKPTQFPTTAAELAMITTFASAHGRTFPDPDALAVEVKSAWIETAGLANKSHYITTQAVIPTYDKSKPKKWVKNGEKTTELALVGMHVVGSANGHPEMIWATFEHFGNAPNAAYSYTSTSGTTKTVPRDTTGTWLFCKSGAASPFNEAHMTFSSGDIVAVAPHNISPTNIIRWKPFGGASNASPNPVDTLSADSNSEIISIDNSVSSKMPSGDIRNHYYMTGATWTINGKSFNTNFGNPGNSAIVDGRGVGTSQLANTSMETFQQINHMFNKHANNCFNCHKSDKLRVSHVACDEVFGCSAGIQPLF
ncbi:MAG TPA: hypothetical protein VMU45_05905 [Candidatus Eisenbacteria bacterium]|nr:hypothetical protein [Candidatus Eisenbacteria bacterium]